MVTASLARARQWASRRRGGVRTWLGTVATVVTLGAGLVRAATAPPVDAPTAPSEKLEREAFELLAREERGMRVQAAKNFLGDPWSQDDDFHNAQRKRAVWFSDRKGHSLPHVLRAVDEGMRGRWPVPAGALVIPTVAPCRPRLDY
jgi:hypothetical protein